MRLDARQAATILAAVIVVAAGFFGGRFVHSNGDAGFEFDLDAAVYDAALPEAGLSKGGFSGFGETPGLPGKTLLSGKVVSASGVEVVIEDANGSRSTIRLANPGGVKRIESAARSALTGGATVVLRHALGSDEVEAVLVVESP